MITSRVRSLMREVFRPSWDGTLLLLTLLGGAVVAYFCRHPPVLHDILDETVTVRISELKDSRDLPITDYFFSPPPEANTGRSLDEKNRMVKQVFAAFARDITQFGKGFGIHIRVKEIVLLTRQGAKAASWETDEPLMDTLSKEEWPVRTVWWPNDATGEDTRVKVVYAYSTESRPNVSVSQRFWHKLARYSSLTIWINVILVLLGILAIRERIVRRHAQLRLLQAQQEALDQGHQLCHELRNGLWAFALESRNLRVLFQLVEDFFSAYPKALQSAAERVGLDPARREAFRRAFELFLAEHNLDPETDILPCNAMAREAGRQLEPFSHYVKMTVEEMDWNLLSARGRWQNEPIRPSEAWKQTRDLLSMQLTSAGVRSRPPGEVEGDWVLGDRRALTRVFVNLAKNALEAMHGQTGPRELDFEVSVDDQRVYCSVRNSGPPIAPEHLPHIFDRGFSTKRGSGRGVGLAVVREILAQMRGTVEVTSDATRGTCFRLTFPRSAGPPSTPIS